MVPALPAVLGAWLLLRSRQDRRAATGPPL
jgi:hypothetical protein